MARRPAAPQDDLLDWTPPEPVTRFEPRAVQAASLSARISKAIALTLREHPASREAVAAAMGTYLGRKFPVSSLNAYAAESRVDDVINVVLFMALISVTGDRRLLELLAGEMGWAVIERRWLRLIDLAAVQEREAELRSQASALRRMARAEGTL
jgi:hypothetical protein